MIKKITHKQISKMAAFNEYKSKTVIKNMFYKDSSCPIVAFLHKNSIEPVHELISKHKEDESSCCYYRFGGKKFHAIFTDIRNTERMVDTIKVADCLVYCVDSSAPLDLEIIEGISMANGIGSLRMYFMEIYRGKQKGPIEKRLSKETGVNVRLLDINQLSMGLKRFKTRPIELKCKNAFFMADRVEGNKIFGFLRGKPIDRDLLEALDVFGQKKLKIVRISLEKEVTSDLRQMDVDQMSDDDQISNSEDSINHDDESISNEDTIDNGSTESDFKFHDDTKSHDDTKFHDDTKAENDKKKKITENFLMKDKKKEFENFISKNQIIRETEFLPGDYLEIEIEDFSGEEILLFFPEKKDEETPSFQTGLLYLNKFYKNSRNRLKLNFENLRISTGFSRLPFDSKKMAFSRNQGLTMDITNDDVYFNGSTSLPLGEKFMIYSVPGQNDCLTDSDYFRILGSGTFTGTAPLFEQLNLVGYPKSIGGNTVMGTGMFHSDKECLRFLSAKLTTLSGLRGVLKSFIGKGGDFRATFEGPILKSDVIILRIRREIQGEISEKDEKYLEMEEVSTADEEDDILSEGVSEESLVAPEDFEMHQKQKRKEILEKENAKMAQEKEELRAERKNKKKEEEFIEKMRKKRENALKSKKMFDKKKRHKGKRRR